MHGGQAIPAFDFYLAPYVRLSYIEELKALEDLTGEDYKDLYEEPLMDYIKKPLDGLTGKERAQQHAINKTVGRVHQSMEAFIHNMNTIHSRGGNQVVFSSINYGTDTSAEGRCIMREILLSTYEGVGNGETAIFPIQIWKKKRGVNYLPEDRNFDLYQLACKVTARRFFPNFLNLDASYNQDSEWRADDPKRYIHEVATMGCRTRVFENRFGARTSIGRGNLSFSTINIVKLAIEAALEEGGIWKEESEMPQEMKDKRIALFFAKLDRMLELTAKQLDDRFQFQKTAFAKQFPLLMKSLWIGADKLKATDTIEPVINQGTLGIGFIGLAECLVALIGKHHGESEEAQQLGLKIVTYMRDRVNEFSERYQHNYSVLATPAEGLAGKFTKVDRKDFGVIPGVTDRDYYTNSNHVPVYYKCSARHKAEVEAPYHDLTRGGHIFYVEIDGDATHNPQVIMNVVDMMDRLNMGYGSVNHNRNRCMDCGYENADPNMKRCPRCGSENIDRLQRITGYLVGTTDRWNHGKLAELNDRVTHIDNGNQLELFDRL
jgi:ribonucleoside-triphosphate reductase